MKFIITAALAALACGVTAEIPEESVQLPSFMQQVSMSPRSKFPSVTEKDPLVMQLMAEISQFELLSDLETLTQTFHTRNSYSQEVHDTQHMLERYYAKLSRDFEISTLAYNADEAENVIAVLPGTNPDLPAVLVGAHYDSRMEDVDDAHSRAPGADDDGSGTVALLALARAVIRLRERGIKFSRSIRFVHFCGEEQGLHGSIALAKHYFLHNVPLYAMLNMDMLGFQAGDRIVAGFKDARVSKSLTQASMDYIHTYMPGLPTEYSSSCCSDYMPFFAAGYDVVGFFESAKTASDYPYYHTSEDTVDKVNVFQMQLLTQAIASVLGTLTHMHN
ncbi:MAG: hypothetical protein MHM6MM_003868 [Cercozoa sp. M6MM]